MNPICSCGKFHDQLAKSPPLVLVIDDEPLVRWSLTAGLRAAGFDAIAAADRAQALQLAHEPRKPAVVLLDVRLWNTDPGRLLADLREALPHGHFLVLAVTGQEVPYAAFKDVDVIRKPYDLPDVVRVVEAAACPLHRMMRPAV